MADLNPNAPVYIPSLHLLSLESYYSPFPPLHQPSSLHPFSFLYNQSPYENNVFYASSPLSYAQDLCYHLLPQTFYTSCYFQIPQPYPARPHPLPLPVPLPLPLPTCGLDQPRPSLTLRSEEKKKDEPQEDGVSETQGGVVGREGDMGVKGSKGFRGFGNDSFAGKSVGVQKPPRRHGGLPPFLRPRKLTGDYEFKKVEPGAGDSIREAKTTVMIKNLPNKLTTENLLAILDQHCLHENYKKALSLKREEEASDAAKLGDAEAITTLSAFDFLHLPIDFRSGRNNLGYAFVNFTSSIAAWRLYDYLHDFEWKCFGSRKTCEVTYARIQDLREHFKSSVFICERDQFLPMCFQPSRNGFNRPEPEYVGWRIRGASQVTE